MCEHPQPSLADSWTVQQKLGQGEEDVAPTLLDYQNASPTGRKGGWQGLGRRWSDMSVTDVALLLGTRVTCFISLYSKNLEIKIDGGGWGIQL